MSKPSDELKPCPFCDGPVHPRTEGDIVGCYHIGRPHCPVGRWWMTVEQWNTRIEAAGEEGLRSALEDIRNRLLCPVSAPPSPSKILEIASAALEQGR